MPRCRIAPLLAAALLLFSLAAPARAALDRELLERINASVFEVVALKPTADSLSYERPLPLELLPYLERTDKYISLGTAFAVAPGEYVTAAHVLGSSEASVYRDYFIRDVAGQVFPLADILAYSSRRDFAVFTVGGRPAGASLPVNPAPELNGKVYAVGNALGEGIVIRDGLYTSTTPEEIAGAWKWQRFSAAASPGNSGGPLLDEAGRVIGVIERKSPNENLNVALPIAEVLAAPRDAAHVYARGVYSLDNLQRNKVDTIDVAVPLPQPYPALRRALSDAQEQFSAKMLRELLAEEQEHTFPNGRESLPLLFKGAPGGFPTLIVQRSDGSWEAPENKETRTVELEKNGALTLGRAGRSLLLQLRKPDDLSLAALLGDGRLVLDTVQKVLGIKRQVGMDRVRITSFGAPRGSERHVDRYGRTWLLHHWVQEYSDQAMALLVLPVPGGCIALLRWDSSDDLYSNLLDLRALADFVSVGYRGGPADWREFLAQRELLPQVFAGIRLDLDAAGGLTYRSPRLAFTLPAELRLGSESELTLNFGFFRDGAQTVWDVRELSVAVDRHRAGRVSLVRAAQPPRELGDKYRSDWETIAAARVPYNRAPYSEGQTTVIAAARPAGAPELFYTVNCVVEGAPGEERMTRLLDEVLAGLQVLEGGR